MSLLVVGSVALDTIKTPHGERESILGGAASYFSVGASHFAPVRLVGVIGEDFPAEHVELLAERGVDLEGLERRAGGKTFRWTGAYEGRMDVAQTLDTQLNVLGSFKPDLPASFRDSRFAFLANTDPVTQKHVAEQLTSKEFVMLDTMNFWIDSAQDALRAALGVVDGAIMNDEEARALGGSQNLIKAMHTLADGGLKTLVVKKGEHGATLLHEGRIFSLPAYPLPEVFDPTGAGDSFASGFMGEIARSGDLSFDGLRRALAVGCVVASFTVEGFGLERLLSVDRAALDQRLETFLAMVTF